jgi:hypothetical protein
MPTPMITFRLSQPAQDSLREIAVHVSGGNVSELLRRMAETIASGDANKIAEFNAVLLGALGRQLTLNLLQDTPRRVDPVARTRKRGERRGRGAGKGRKGARRRVRKP